MQPKLKNNKIKKKVYKRTKKFPLLHNHKRIKFIKNNILDQKTNINFYKDRKVIHYRQIVILI